MVRGVSLRRLFAYDREPETQAVCRECGYAAGENEPLETETHTGGFGAVAINLCPRCDTIVETRWSAA